MNKNHSKKYAEVSCSLAWGMGSLECLFEALWRWPEVWWPATGGSGEKGSADFCKEKVKHCMDFSGLLYFKRESRGFKRDKPPVGRVQTLEVAFWGSQGSPWLLQPDDTQKPRPQDPNATDCAAIESQRRSMRRQEKSGSRVQLEVIFGLASC